MEATPLLLPETEQEQEGTTGVLSKRLLGFPAVLLVGLVTTVVLVSTGPQMKYQVLSDPDIWCHLRNAEYLIHTGSFIRRDLYSFTALGHSWINTEWLSELPYYFGWKLLGERGLYLVLLTAMESIVAGIFCLSYLNTRNVKAAFLTSWMAVLLGAVSFGPRALLFGWMCLVAELIVLSRFREGKDWTWTLPLIFAVWINAHGSWLIGIVFLINFVVCGCIRKSWGNIQAVPLLPRQIRKMTLIGILSMLALFANPYGWRLVVNPFDLAFTQKLNVGIVEEWQSVNFHSLQGKLMLGTVALLAVLNLRRPRKWPLDELVLAAIAIYAAFTYQRFLFLAGIVICPFLARDLSFVSSYRNKSDKRLLNAAILAILLVAVFARFPDEKQLQESAAFGYPAEALHYLHNVRLEGRVLNRMEWGGFLIWNTPQIPVFIDSRMDLYEHAGVLADYMRVIMLKDPLAILNKYRIRYVLFPAESPLSDFLRNNSGWKVEYTDGVTTLFERTGSEDMVRSAH